jgi:hypothetical protein
MKRFLHMSGKKGARKRKATSATTEEKGYL